jgi:hypothetical protein
MANKDNPCGFRPKGTVKEVRVFESGAAIYPGDAVRLSDDGKIDPVAAGETILGIALTYASAAGVEVNVSVDPDQLYVVQADETEVDAQTDIGNVADLVATAGSSTYFVSRMELDSSNLNTTSGQLLLLGIDKRKDNAFGAQVDCVVKINERQLTNAFAGI